MLSNHLTPFHRANISFRAWFILTILVATSVRLSVRGQQIASEMATYEEVKDVPNHPEKYLIDVRTRVELAEIGVIPASINVPLDELEEALRGPADEFAVRYGREKPAKDAVIIFTCRSGKRAATATNLAQKLGYVKSKTYGGSWLEWAAKEGL